MYTLFGTRGSGSAAVEAALEAIGAPFRIVHASSWEPDSALAELKAANPLAQIPTLRLPDGSVLTESAAILLHLALAHPEAGLLPEDATARAQAIRGLVFIAANCYSCISIGDYPERWLVDPDPATNERVRQGARAQLHRHWEIFAETFPARPYFSGERVGALDFLAAVVSKWSGTRAHVKAQQPEFFAALERVEKEPVVAQVFARHWA